MFSPKFLALSLLMIFLGAAVGSSATYFIQARRHKADLMRNTASLEYLAAEDFLEQISLLDKQDYENVKSRLNYRLAERVYDAKINEHEHGDSGFFFQKTLDVSAEQRKRKEYLVQEEKVIKELSEFKLVRPVD